MNKLYSEIMLISTAGFEMREIEGNIRILTTYTSLCRYNPVGMQKKVLQFLCAGAKNKKGKQTQILILNRKSTVFLLFYTVPVWCSHSNTHRAKGAPWS